MHHVIQAIFCQLKAMNLCMTHKYVELRKRGLLLPLYLTAKNGINLPHLINIFDKNHWYLYNPPVRKQKINSMAYEYVPDYELTSIIFY